jgi:hypothetical protein
MFSRQCLGRDRISTRRTLDMRAADRCARMNAQKLKIDWNCAREKAQNKVSYKRLEVSKMGH